MVVYHFGLCPGPCVPRVQRNVEMGLMNQSGHLVQIDIEHETNERVVRLPFLPPVGSIIKLQSESRRLEVTNIEFYANDIPGSILTQGIEAESGYVFVKARALLE